MIFTYKSRKTNISKPQYKYILALDDEELKKTQEEVGENNSFELKDGEDDSQTKTSLQMTCKGRGESL
ncbi:hypothetical protein GCM10010301_73660 [Streptomyces plicatus]|nr:hypothetical protein GCM10010301_73660 [Streptomyces plicatus]